MSLAAGQSACGRRGIERQRDRRQRRKDDQRRGPSRLRLPRRRAAVRGRVERANIRPSSCRGRAIVTASAGARRPPKEYAISSRCRHTRGSVPTAMTLSSHASSRSIPIAEPSTTAGMEPVHCADRERHQVGQAIVAGDMRELVQHHRARLSSHVSAMAGRRWRVAASQMPSAHSVRRSAGGEPNATR